MQYGVDPCHSNYTVQPDGCTEVIDLAAGTVTLDCTCLHDGINGTLCDNGQCAKVNGQCAKVN